MAEAELPDPQPRIDCHRNLPCMAHSRLGVLSIHARTSSHGVQGHRARAGAEMACKVLRPPGKPTDVPHEDTDKSGPADYFGLTNQLLSSRSAATRLLSASANWSWSDHRRAWKPRTAPQSSRSASRRYLSAPKSSRSAAQTFLKCGVPLTILWLDTGFAIELPLPLWMSGPKTY